MKILEYRGLDTTKVKKQYEKVLNYLRNNDFRSAEVKKIPETDLYRAKLDDRNRLLFKIVKHKGENYALILEVIWQHAYEKSKFLRGARIDEAKLKDLVFENLEREKVEEIEFLNPESRYFHIVFDRIITFNQEQNQAYFSELPLIIIGPAGSGKTVVTVEKSKLLTGKGLFISLSPYLVRTVREIYQSNFYGDEENEIDFLSFREFIESIRIPEEKEIKFSNFAGWYYRYPKNLRPGDAHSLFEEFRGVITGSNLDQPYLTKEQYLSLGVRQSIFLGRDRELAYGMFEKYLIFLKENKLYDPNILSFHYLNLVKPTYDFVVVDEVQDFTPIQLYLILKSLKNNKNFILCGDSNQIVHPNFFSWSRIKSMFYQAEEFELRRITQIIRTNFRNSISVTDLSNKILKLKQLRFGSIDRESNYLMVSETSRKGSTLLLKNNQNAIKELNRASRLSNRYAVIVLRDEDKAKAKGYFETPLLFSIHEAKGLEYENVILYNIVSTEREKFSHIAFQVKENELEGELKYSRASDKADKSLEIYKFFINSFYVATTRAVDTLFIVEDDFGHPFLRVLGLKNPLESVRLEETKSSMAEWEKEARKLELLEKHEQAEEIRQRILKKKPVPWEVITEERILSLAQVIKTAKDNPQKPRLALFNYALFYGLPIVIRFLSMHNFVRASQIFFTRDEKTSFNRELYEQQRRNFIQNLLSQYLPSKDYLLRQIENYGANYRIEFNAPILTLAALKGDRPLIEELINRGADREERDLHGLTPWHRAFQRALFDFGYIEAFSKIHELIVPPELKLRVGDRLIKVETTKIEFWILNFLILKIFDFFYTDSEFYLPITTAGELVQMLNQFPESLIPEYRKMRKYLQAVLARHEVESKNPYSKQLFVRLKRGLYSINPHILFHCQENWLSIEKYLNLKFVFGNFSDIGGDFESLLTDLINHTQQKEPKAKEKKTPKGKTKRVKNEKPKPKGRERQGWLF